MTNKPAWASEYVTYKDIVKSWGWTIVHFETFGSYQGDHLALLHRGTETGLMVFGYGSCSGCDELQGVTPWAHDDEPADWSPVINLATRLRDSVHWEPSQDALRRWVDETPENHWWSYNDEIASWLNRTLSTHLNVQED